MKLLLESFKSYTQELLSEIKMEQVLPRFESKAFINAANQLYESTKEDPFYEHPRFRNMTPAQIVANFLLEDILPSDIEEKYKPEALNWIISMFIKNWDEVFTHEYKMGRSLEIFYHVKQMKMDRILSKNSIHDIKSIQELIDIVEIARPAWKEYKKQKQNKDAELGTNKIHEDENWEVFIPENKGAACKLGMNTDWCTAARGLEYYEQYHKSDDPLIIFISKQDPTEKYQFHYGSKQFMDKNDQQIRRPSKLFYELNSIIMSSDKVPDAIRQEAEKNNQGYEPLSMGAYKTTKKEVVAGKKFTEEKYFNALDQVSRTDGPSYIQYNEDGNKIYESWTESNGKLHREDGPAIIAYNNDGTIDYQEYYLHGRGMSYYDWKEKVEEMSDEASNLKEIIKQELIRALEERKLSKPSSETNLGDWFKRKGAPGKKGGWVDCNTCRDGKCKSCGRQAGEKRSKYPRCRPTPSQCKGYKRRGSNLQKEVEEAGPTQPTRKQFLKNIEKEE